MFVHTAFLTVWNVTYWVFTKKKGVAFEKNLNIKDNMIRYSTNLKKSFHTADNFVEKSFVVTVVFFREFKTFFVCVLLVLVAIKI